MALRLRQQELVAEFAAVTLSDDSLEAALHAVCRIAAVGLQCKFAKVLRFLPAENVFLVEAGVGWRDGVVGHAVLGGDLASPAGYAFHTGKPVLSEHLATETRFRTPELLIEHGVHRAFNVLIAGAGRPYGVLEADSTDREAFAPADVGFLQPLASLLAHAIEKQQRINQKDLLMLEVHHRVKNSLQLVQNLLTLQARAAADTETGAILTESAARVRTIASLHDRLYKASGDLTIEIQPYLTGLVDDLRQALVSTFDGRTIEVAFANAVWPAADAPTLGLVLTELVTNALKYGAGVVRVRFTQESTGQALLVVEDEGDSLRSDFSPARSRGLGMRLITGLLKAKAGTLSLERAPGCTRFLAALSVPGAVT